MRKLANNHIHTMSQQITVAEPTISQHMVKSGYKESTGWQTRQKQRATTIDIRGFFHVSKSMWNLVVAVIMMRRK